jgi:hypothetical protein
MHAEFKENEEKFRLTRIEQQKRQRLLSPAIRVRNYSKFIIISIDAR